MNKKDRRELFYLRKGCGKNLGFYNCGTFLEGDYYYCEECSKKFVNKKLFIEKKIKENLKLVEEGKALNLPLAILDGKFKKEYFEKARRKTDRYKQYKKEYNKTDKRRKWIRDYVRRKYKIPKSRWRIKD